MIMIMIMVTVTVTFTARVTVMTIDWYFGFLFFSHILVNLQSSFDYFELIVTRPIYKIFFIIEYNILRLWKSAFKEQKLTMTSPMKRVCDPKRAAQLPTAA
ncbi:hypothetical protein J3Q64DRAFT_1698299 [Phycomyces blakesleeanus]|uniref:Uncharacterized protein n=2 Tax=Phycomyces blakesleeanus TaxID=4837 RepID=A0A162PRJ6_PHYB8|nr:hypothetical protein PHYBLDRAFT_64252 [Phycomyces blakesleeanus NRRL 1555(-)]OAD75327.1 hypothetical protein PHYBLDRAFT_64252 [Phycomyces blakesleeanus NRRL 1555(-)]|eukprot:XP_018293367.1 hypothetical protein PHYBLDRAFT_64252 [Phycomyces blakesleeanus NRRL 1555(-)]